MYISKPHARRAPFEFLRDDDGAITVEAVLWLPVYLVFFSLIVDVSLMFHGYSKALRIAQDASRHASTGYYIDENDVKGMAEASLASFSPNATVKATIDEDAVTPYVLTEIKMPASDLQAIGFVAVFANIEISVNSVHMLEL